MNKKAAFRKKKQHNKAGMILVTFVLVMMFIVVAANSINLTSKQADLIARQEALEQEIAEQEQYTQELVELKKYTKTKKFAEEVAKEKLGLVYEDEIVFKPEE